MKLIPLLLSVTLILLESAKKSESQLQGVDNIFAIKRPFCNAFTGCGRKRDPLYAMTEDSSQPMPLPLYKALLLRLANIAEKDDPVAVLTRQRLAQLNLIPSVRMIDNPY